MLHPRYLVCCWQRELLLGPGSDEKEIKSFLTDSTEIPPNTTTKIPLWAHTVNLNPVIIVNSVCCNFLFFKRKLQVMLINYEYSNYIINVKRYMYTNPFFGSPAANLLELLRQPECFCVPLPGIDVSRNSVKTRRPN